MDMNGLLHSQNCVGIRHSQFKCVSHIHRIQGNREKIGAQVCFFNGARRRRCFDLEGYKEEK